MFTRTLLCACIHIRVIREVDVDEAMWEDVGLVFREGIWTQMIDQWSRTAHSVTRALVLNLFAIDVSQLADRRRASSTVLLRRARTTDLARMQPIAQ